MRVLLISLALLITVVAKAEKVAYKLAMPAPHTHYFEVEMQISEITDRYVEVKMPVWAPGSYLVREFARHVEAFDANNGKSGLDVEVTNKNTWKINTAGAKLINVSYKVYAFELSVRTSFLDADHGYLNGTSMFMYTDASKESPMSLEVIPYNGWKKVSTSLTRLDEKRFLYSAPNYDILVDSPIEIGNHKEITFDAAGVAHTIAMFGEGNYVEDDLKKDMAKIVEACTDVVGENPNKKYLFIIHNLTNGSGGLEHLSSTTLEVERWGYAPGKEYLGFLSLVAHEYFHLWNVKRIRPKALGPFNYDAENYTRLLWVAEGFTSYYDELLLRRAGFYNEAKILNKFAGTMTRMENQPGGKVQAVGMASFHAWTKAYRSNENSYNTTISYYPKGACVALCLDLMIINATNGEKNLDNVLRVLYDKYYKKAGTGFTEAELKKELETLIGKNLDDLFNNNINGTQPLDYNEYLKGVGCKLVNTPKEGFYFGAGTTSGSKVMVRSVVRGSAAYNGGLNVNDEIIAVNGYRLGASSLTQLLSEEGEGATVKMLVARDGLLKNLDIKLTKKVRVKYSIEKLDKVSDKQAANYKKWLSL